MSEADNVFDLPKWERPLAAAQALTDLTKNIPALASLELTEALKIGRTAWVFSGHWQDQKVAVKRVFGPNTAARIRNMKTELDLLDASWTDPRCRANRCLGAFPDHGIAVLSFAPGARLSKALAAATGTDRTDLLCLAGVWLAQYCASRQRESAFAALFWLRKLKAVEIPDKVEEPDRKLLAALMQNLGGQADRIKGCHVVQAATHGDYVGINAHYHDGVIYGLDIQGEAWFPIARDAARFLVFHQIHSRFEPRVCRYGVDVRDLDAFLASGVISAVETETTLPFFIGTQLYHRFLTEYRRARIRDNTRAAIAQYLGT